MNASLRKFTAIIVALVTLISCLPVVVFAAGDPVLWVSPVAEESFEETRPVSSLKWWYDKADETYYLFLPTAADATALQIWLENAVNCTVDGFAFQSGDPIALLTKGKHTVTIDGTDYPLEVMQSANIGTMYVTTESGNMNYIHQKKGNKESGYMMMLDADGKTVYDNTLDEIKGRGNATWSRPKKPYQIKLDKKTELVEDAGKNKTWILLANYLERSLMRNAIAYDMAYEAGLTDTSLSTYVDLYCNGEYRGTYQLTEKVHINDDRVEINNLEDTTQDVNEEDLDSYPAFGPANASTPGSRKGFEIPNNPDDITGGYLLELDHADRYTAEASGFVTTRGQAVVIKEPEYASREQVNYIANFFQEFEDAVFAEDGKNPTTGKYYYEYFDLTSLARKYIIEEITKNIDADVTSQYFYKPSDTESTIGYCGPVWDYDNSMGNHGSGNALLPEGLYAATKKNYILKNLYKKESFLNAVYAEWDATYRPLMEMTTSAETSPAGSRLKTMTEYYNMLEPSAAMNFTYWENINSVDTENYNDTGDTYEEHVAFLRNFLSGRLTYLNTIWSADNIAVTQTTKTEPAPSNELPNIQTFSGTASDTFVIGSEADLRKLAELVSAGNTFSGVTLIQIADITLTKEFIPAGNGPTLHKFNGTYNGQGYKISNLIINQPDQDGVGLFAYAQNATFIDVHITGGTIVGDNRVGSIAGYGDKCTFTRCSNGASLSSDNNSGKDGIGGLTGVSRSGTVFTSCYNTGSISGSNPGGISGWGQATVTLTNCWNAGAITDPSNNGAALCRTSSALDFSTCYYFDECGEIDSNGANSFSKNALTDGSLTAALNETSAVWEQGTANPTLKTPERKGLIVITVNRYFGDTLLDTAIQCLTQQGTYTVPSYQNIIKSVQVNGVETDALTVDVTANTVIDIHLKVQGKPIQQLGESGNYFISNVADLTYLLERSRYQSLKNCNFFLLSDIDAASITIGGGRFEGTLNGLNHTIRNLSAPLFTEITKTAELRKLSIVGGNISSNGIFGLENKGRIFDVALQDVVIYGTNAGGIVGVNYGEISGCSVDGYVIGPKSAGGIAAINYGQISDCANNASIVSVGSTAAGISAANFGIVDRCLNVGMLYGDARYAVANQSETNSYSWDWCGGEGASELLGDVQIADRAMLDRLHPTLWEAGERFPAPAQNEIVRGDANGDQRVNLSDALRMLKYLNELIGEEEIDLNCADMNADGFSITDAIRLLKYLNGPKAVSQPPQEESDPYTIKLIDYNIRYTNDGENKNFSDRAPRLWSVIEEYDPDIIGLQEVVPTWLTYLETYFGDEYTIFLKYRASSSLEATPILYKTDKYNELDRGYFWLSDTPDVESKGWGASHFRICNWVKLEDKVTGEIFLYYNSHFHGTDTFHAGAAPLIIEHAKAQGGFTEYPVLLTGDFNTTKGTDGYMQYVNGPFENLNGDDNYDFTPTTSGYDPGPENGHIIDYVFYDENLLTPKTYKVLNEKIMGGYTSDHNGIYAEIGLVK